MQQHMKGVALSELLAIRPQTWIVIFEKKKKTAVKLMWPQ